MKITHLFVYPIKALKGISLSEATFSDKGFEYDRYWMVVDENGIAITQREIPKMALFEVSIRAKDIQVTYQNEAIHIPKIKEEKGEVLSVKMFDNDLIGEKESDKINDWFSNKLGQKAFLVRPVSERPRYMKRHPEAKVAFPDSSQYLILGEAAMTNLNDQLEEELDINRFRPNIVFSGGNPHDEDHWETIQIGEAIFEKNKLCARCQVTTINQETGMISKEPLKTMASYRKKGNKVLFGTYFKLTKKGQGSIKLNQEISLIINH